MFSLGNLNLKMYANFARTPFFVQRRGQLCGKLNMNGGRLISDMLGHGRHIKIFLGWTKTSSGF